MTETNTPHTPQPIHVQFPESNDEGSTHDASMQTGLFRTYTYLPEALRMAVERTPGSNMTAISAGSSIGAEADSLIALHKREGYEGDLSVTGFDLNKLAIETASKGLYKALFHPEGYEATMAMLRDMGFGASYAGSETNQAGEMRDRVDVDAAPLRAGYKMRFAEHDLLKPLPLEGADLILANNVLHKVLPPLSDTMARNLGQALSERGVLSLDATSLAKGDPRTPDALRVLNDEFGIVPLVEKSLAGERTPVILGRP